eukprot:CAMPEP_0206147306 /NCGR_PEP_ID=MMETSP1473-20131121/33046_1 /ASSEMBLY_ACC=CAM_ASM_001109 /TAXON_ID=1461547 /ORGANISM="Stichococcus sp, Strain RCC1054" /LENGTH=820 /DNA_ID=CAMNT_0053544195 /DNA_START=160 /DNA_END=2618 /DNA_ORIENTATION=+
MDAAAQLEQFLSLLPSDAASKLRTLLLEPKEGIRLDDAALTLQVILAKMRQKGLRPEHMAWPNIAACVWLLCSTDSEAMFGRASSGFSHRELYWMVEQDLMGYNSGCGYSRRFCRCLPCAVGKPGPCGGRKAAWFCRRRLDILDTSDRESRHEKTAALDASGSTLLPSRSMAHVLCRGLDVAGKPLGPSRKTTQLPPGDEENDFVSLTDRLTWLDQRATAKKGAALPSDDKSETFVAQTRSMMQALSQESPNSKWVAVNRATTKRYVGNLKRLASKDAVARKKRSAEEGVLLELTPHFLEQTELKRWPDYHFLIGQREPEKCVPPEQQARSACFLNAQTRGWVAAMQPADHSKMPPWHQHGAEAAALEAACSNTGAMVGSSVPAVVTDRQHTVKHIKCSRRGSARGTGSPDSSGTPSPHSGAAAVSGQLSGTGYGSSDHAILSSPSTQDQQPPPQSQDSQAHVTQTWQLSSAGGLPPLGATYSVSVSADEAALLLQHRGAMQPHPPPLSQQALSQQGPSLKGFPLGQFTGGRPPVHGRSSLDFGAGFDANEWRSTSLPHLAAPSALPSDGVSDPALLRRSSNSSTQAAPIGGFGVGSATTNQHGESRGAAGSGATPRHGPISSFYDSPVPPAATAGATVSVAFPTAPTMFTSAEGSPGLALGGGIPLRATSSPNQLRHSSGSGGYGAALAADGPLRIPSVPGGAPPRGLAGGVQHVEFNFATTSGDSGRPPASLGGCHSRNGGLQGSWGGSGGQAPANWNTALDVPGPGAGSGDLARFNSPQHSHGHNSPALSASRAGASSPSASGGSNPLMAPSLSGLG